MSYLLPSRAALFIFALAIIGQLPLAHAATDVLKEIPKRPNIVLVMADDMGWGQTGYYNHPVLKTPNLDAMAKNGLRFDRFYAAAPVCSPTRASVLTGRSNMRCGVNSHGHSLRRQEKTIAQALQTAGYATGHFGKWHLNGMRGPGVPIFNSDSHHPGVFGFDEWISVTNFFDRDPIMSRRGEFEEFSGDSSEIIVDQALEFVGRQAKANKPSLSVIWYGTPHSPFRADEKDAAPFSDLDKNSQSHYGELVAMDRSIGTLRKGLRDLGIADNTLLWFTSDNGGLPKIQPDTVGGLRGYKGSVYEGGLRVPTIVEWPAAIKPRVTKFPACAVDIFPTVADLLGLPDSVRTKPVDGMSLTELFQQEIARREKPIPFNCLDKSAVIDNDFKIIQFAKKQKRQKKQDKRNSSAVEIYNLADDPKETVNLAKSNPQLAKRMQRLMDDWLASMNRSVAGKDYAEGKLLPGDPAPRFWTDVKAYEPYFEAWKSRPEYASRLKPKKRSK